MLIRSQDKKLLVNMAGCSILVNVENEVIIFGNNSEKESETMTLGYYPNEEKAVKVLNDIGRSYTGSLWTETHYDSAAMANVPEIIANNVVFEMPEY